MKPLKHFLLALLLLTSQSWAAFTLAVTVPAGGTHNVDAWGPSLILPIPNQQTNSGQVVTMDLGRYLQCAPYFGSPTNNCVWSWVVAPTGPSTSSIDANGVLTATMVGAQTSLQLRVTSSFGGGTSAVSNVFNWNLNGAPPVGVVATGYFVDCAAGSDAAAGTSFGAAWRTLAKVTATSKPASSDVWIKAGTTCQPTTSFDINWSGTAANAVFFGTYYVNAGVAYQLLPSNYTPSTLAKDYTWASARAIIQGSYRPSCRVWPSKCAFGGAGGLGTPGTAVPSGQYTGLVQTLGSDYVTVQSLEIRDSAGVGLRMGDGAGPYCYGAAVPACVDNQIIQFNKIDHVTYGSIVQSRSSFDIVRGNEFSYAGLHHMDSQTTTDGGSGGYYIVQCEPCHTVVENNSAHDMAGEPFVLGAGSFVLFRGNMIGNTNRVGYYHDASSDTVNEQTMFMGGKYTQEAGLGNPNGIYYNDGPAFYSMTVVKEPCAVGGPCIGQASGASKRHLFRNNFSATFQTCMNVDMNGTTTALASGKWVNNTCVGDAGEQGWGVAGGGGPAAVDPSGLQVQNNIIAVLSGVTGCNNYTTPLIALSNNFWTGTPADVDCRGSGDKYSTWALLALPSHNWTTNKNNIPDASWFIPPAGSSAASGAATLSSVYLTQASWQWEYDHMVWYPACASGLPTITEWLKLRTIDYCGAPANGSFGALNHP